MLLELIVTIRRIARRRTSAALVVLTMALVGGVSAAVLSVAYKVYLRPLSYPGAHDLVRITGRTAEAVGTVNVSPPDFRDLRQSVTTFSSLAAVSPFTPQLTLTGNGDPIALDGRRISSRYFETLGLPLIAGREFVDSEEQPPAKPVILGERFCRKTFDSASVLGRVVTLNGEAHQVVGIAPDREEIFGRADIWLPMQFPSSSIRGLRIVAVVGRVKAGVTVDQAGQEVAAIGRRLQDLHPSTNGRWQPVAMPLGESVAAPLRSPLALTVEIVALLWLAACAAIAGLAISQTLQRGNELKLRQSLGARTSQVLRAAVADFLVLGCLGCVGAIGLAHWVTNGLRVLGLTPPAYAHDWRLSVVSVSVLVLVATGSAMAAALLAWKRVSVQHRGASHVAAPVRHILVGAQIAGAVGVVGVAAMLLGGVITLRTTDLGFHPQEASYLTLSLPPRYKTPEARARFWVQLVNDLDGLPGVHDAAITSELPFTGQQNPTAFLAASADGRETSVQLRSISPSYFAAAGVAVIEGRAFLPQDDGEHQPVIIINQALARQVFGAKSPLGERLALNFMTPAHQAHIVGVVASVRHAGPSAAEAPEVYAPAAQTPLPRYTVLLRTNLEPRALLPMVEHRIHEADGDLAVSIPTRWSDAVDERFAPHQTRLALVIGLASIAIMLAALSAFGTLGESVSMRSQEFALRIALGATPTQLVRTLTIEVWAFAAPAIAAGLCLMWMLRTFTASALDGMTLPRVWPEMAAVCVVGIVLAGAIQAPLRYVLHVEPHRVLRD